MIGASSLAGADWRYQAGYGQPTAPTRVTSVPPSVSSNFQKAIEQYKPNGELVKATKTQLNALQKKYMAGVESDLARRGLSASTLGAGAETTFAKDIAAPTLAAGEASRVSNLAQLYQALAGVQQGAFENSENRQIGAAQFNTQQQAQQQAQQGQLGLGYAQLGAQTNLGQQGLDLERLKLMLSQQNPTQTMQPDMYGRVHSVPSFSL